jgi:hypothetical protein
MKQLLQDDFQSRSTSVKQMLQHARRITLCIDGWSTKGLTALYFGISACFFDPLSAKPVHAFLNLSNIKHSHTGEKLADCINQSLQQRGITEDKIIPVVSDYGTNTLKAIRLLQAEYAETDEGQEIDESSESGEDVNKDEEDQSNAELQLLHMPFRRILVWHIYYN